MVKGSRKQVFRQLRVVDDEDLFLLVGHMDRVWIREEPPWLKKKVKGTHD